MRGGVGENLMLFTSLKVQCLRAYLSPLASTLELQQARAVVNAVEMRLQSTLEC